MDLVYKYGTLRSTDLKLGRFKFTKDNSYYHHLPPKTAARDFFGIYPKALGIVVLKIWTVLAG